METSTSPLPKTNTPVEALQETLNFTDAIKKVAEGKKIHKLEWEDKEFYGFLYESQLCLHKPDGKNYTWTISEGDLLGDDFVVV